MPEQEGYMGVINLLSRALLNMGTGEPKRLVAEALRETARQAKRSVSSIEIGLDLGRLLSESTDERRLWGPTRLECIKELGYALIYMDYLHPDWPTDQRKRVHELCDELGRNSRESRTDYWRGFLKRIQDEIENMC